MMCLTSGAGVRYNFPLPSVGSSYCIYCPKLITKPGTSYFLCTFCSDQDKAIVFNQFHGEFARQLFIQDII